MPGRVPVVGGQTGCSPRSNPGKSSQPSFRRLVELAQRGHDTLPRTPRRAHRLAQMPVTVAYAPGPFAFSTEEHARIIAEISPPLQ